MQTALNQPAPVRGGDTIWLLGGIYEGAYSSRLSGTPESPIILRQYPGDRATLDGGNSGGRAILTVAGSNTWYWGLEITSSDPHRLSAQTGSWPTDIVRGDGVASGAESSSGIKLINITIHDTRQGVSAFSAWTDTEIYGCLIYYNGWQSSDGGHGHGVYTQNETGTKSITDNVVFEQFSHGLHAYTENSHLNNISVVGNTFFNNGSLTTVGSGRNLLLGGLTVAQNPSVASNLLYYPSGTGPASALDLGYSAGCANATVTDNYVSNNTYFVKCQPTTIEGNTFFGAITGLDEAQSPGNTYSASHPIGLNTFIRPNKFEPGRANVTVFNWDLRPAVDVDLSTVLSAGEKFEVRNAQDFFGTPVVTGTYNGTPVSLPMTGLSVAAPVGWPAPPPSGPEFNAFVVLTERASRLEPRPIDETPRLPRAVTRAAAP